MTTPGMRVAPAASPGSESTTPPSMTSSSSLSEPLPAVQRRNVRVSAAEAAAIMAEHQPRVKYLGPGPGTLNGTALGGSTSGQFVSGSYQNPALRTNPQLTINSSISSPSTAAITSGAGEGVSATTSSTAITGAATVAGTGSTPVLNNATLAASNTGLSVGGNAAATLSPTASSVSLPSGTLAATSLSPTASSAVNPPTTISSFPALAATTTVTQNATGTRTSTNGTTAKSTVTANSTSTGTTAGSVAIANPVRVVNTNGRVTITNQSTRTSNQ